MLAKNAYESKVGQELTSHALGRLAGSRRTLLHTTVSGGRTRNDATAAILNV